MDPEAFELFVVWLRERNVPLSPSEPSSDRQKRYMQLVKLWVLAGKLGVSELQNKVLNHILATAESGSLRLPDPESVVRYAYANTRTGSQLRNFLVALFASRCDIENWRDPAAMARLTTLPEFSTDLGAAMAERAWRAERDLDLERARRTGRSAPRTSRLRYLPINVRLFYVR